MTDNPVAEIIARWLYDMRVSSNGYLPKWEDLHRLAQDAYRENARSLIAALKDANYTIARGKVVTLAHVKKELGLCNKKAPQPE
jgi:hypothetical protein